MLNKQFIPEHLGLSYFIDKEGIYHVSVYKKLNENKSYYIADYSSQEKMEKLAVTRLLSMLENPSDGFKRFLKFVEQ